MEQTIITASKNSYVRNEYVPDCNQESFILVDMSGVRTVKNSYDRRPKPSSTWMTNTEIPLTFTEKYVRDSFAYKYLHNYCGSPSNSYRYAYHYPEPFHSRSYTVSPPWETKLRLKIESTRLNLGSSIAEADETGKMLADAAKRTYKAYKCLKKKLRGKKCRRKRLNSKSFSSAVLAHDFGIAPLVSDIYDSAERLRDDWINNPLKRRFVVTVSDSDTDTSNVYRYFRKEKLSIRAIAQVEFNHNIGEFSFGNPAEWMWERIPFSFVVDWMFDVGDWLNAIDALKGVKRLEVVKISKGTIFTKSISTPYHSNMLEYKPGFVKYKSYKREVLHDIPIGTISYAPSESLRNVWQGLNLLNTLRK